MSVIVSSTSCSASAIACLTASGWLLSSSENLRNEFKGRNGCPAQRAAAPQSRKSAHSRAGQPWTKALRAQAGLAPRYTRPGSAAALGAALGRAH